MSSFQKNYERLNPAQKKAVDTIDGPVMVVAGPGTGKTQILALRIANILQTTDASPENILCLTFTESGVKAMRERLKEFIGIDAYKVDIYTFHGFANDIIQRTPEVFEFGNNATQLDDLQRLKLIQDLIEELLDLKKEQSLYPFYDKFAKQFLIISAIQNLKKEGIGPESLQVKAKTLLAEHEKNIQEYRGKPTRAWIKKKQEFETLHELYEFYKRYQEELEHKQLYDYEDMIMFVINAFRENEDLLAQYQEQYLYIHVDEYQDTNGSQNELLELLGSFDKSPNIFVVGDDDQAIYRFQGANVENILSFNTSFDQVEIIPTTTNYRSTQVILDVADSLIQNNENRLSNKIEQLEKKLYAHADNKKHESIEIIEFDTAEQENTWLAKEINRIHKDESIPFKEIAVLFRKNAHAIDIVDTFNKYEIPLQLQKSENIWENEYIQQFITLLETIVLYEQIEDSALYALFLFDFLEIDPVFVYHFAKFAKRRKQNYLDVFTDEKLIKEFEAILPQNLKKSFEQAQKLIQNIFEWHKIENNQAFPAFIEIVLNDSRLLNYLQLNHDIESIRVFTKLFDYILNVFTFNKDLDLETFLRDVYLARDNNISLSISKTENADDCVTLSTAHGSKGLEFKYVFIVKATDNNWGKVRKSPSLVPQELFSSLAAENIKDLMVEDERRLFFVALTRAKHNVFISYANEYLINGYRSQSAPSRFIFEINESLRNHKKNNQSLNETDALTLLKKTTEKDLTKHEQDYIQTQIESLTLSPSKLNLYLQSPKDFLFTHLLHMPQIKTKEIALGIAVHKAFEQFNRKHIQNIKKLSKELFLDEFGKTIYKEYYGFAEYEATREEGLRLLEDYYDHVLVKDKHFIAESEYNFSGHSVQLEIPGGNPITLTGRIDALSFEDELSQEVTVIDYKTSKYKTENHIRGNTSAGNGNEFRQLVFYKLVADLDSYFRPNKSLSKPKYVVNSGEIIFIKPYKKGEYRNTKVDLTKNDVDDLKQLIEEVITKIRNLEFPEESGLL